MTFDQMDAVENYLRGAAVERGERLVVEERGGEWGRRVPVAERAGGRGRAGRRCGGDPAR
jgi:hypothetical protein